MTISLYSGNKMGHTTVYRLMTIATNGAALNNVQPPTRSRRLWGDDDGRKEGSGSGAYDQAGGRQVRGGTHAEVRELGGQAPREGRGGQGDQHRDLQRSARAPEGQDDAPGVPCLVEAEEGGQGGDGGRQEVSRAYGNVISQGSGSGNGLRPLAFSRRLRQNSSMDNGRSHHETR